MNRSRLKWLLIVVIAVVAGSMFGVLFKIVTGPRRYEIDVSEIDARCMDGLGEVHFLINDSGVPGLGGVVRFRYRLSQGSSADEWSSPVIQPLIKIGGLAEGEYTLEVEARNDEGILNLASCDFRVTCAPGEPPRISLGEPKVLCDRGLTRVAVTWDTVDNHTPTEEIEVAYSILDQKTGDEVDHSLWIKGQNSVESRELVVGSYSVIVFARDQAGNEDSVEVELPVIECRDSLKPEIYDVSAECSRTGNCGHCEIKWSVRDRVTPTSEILSRWNLDGEGWEDSERGPYVSFDCLEPGDHELQILAEDRAGNTGSASPIPLQVPGEIDEPPSIGFERQTKACDARGRATIQAWITIEDDSTPVDRLEVLYALDRDSDSWEIWNETKPAVFANLESGEYTLVVRATDPVGEDAEESFRFWVDCSEKDLTFGITATMCGDAIGVRPSFTIVNREGASWEVNVAAYPSTFTGYPAVRVGLNRYLSTEPALKGFLYGLTAGIYAIPSAFGLPTWWALEIGGIAGWRTQWTYGCHFRLGVSASVGICARYGGPSAFFRIEIEGGLDFTVQQGRRSQ